MSTYLREFDWGTTSLGPTSSWPQALRTAYDIVMSSGFGMCATWGPERTFLYNEAYVPFLGTRHPSALGKPIEKVWPEIWVDIEPLLVRAEAGETIHLENMHLVMTRNGYPEDTYWNFSYSPLRDGDEVAGILDVAVETTALIEAQRSDRTNAERVQLALGAGAIIGTWFWDLPTDSFTVDAAFAETFGLNPALGRTGIPLEQIIATVHPDDREGLVAAIDDAIARRGPYAHQYRVRRADGQYYWIEANGRVDVDAGGVAASFPGVLVDVDERKAVEAERDRATAMLRALNDQLEARVEQRTQELRDSMDFARLALSAVGGVGVWTFDVATDCFTCDANVSRLYDINPEQAATGIKRADFLANVHDDDRAALVATMSGGLSNPGDLELEYRLVHRDRSVHWVLSRGHTYFDDHGAPVRRTGVAVDMTKQRLIEEQLRQSQKMEAVGQLTGGLAHDFNNLLTGMMGNMELLELRLARGKLDEAERLIHAAQAAGRRAASLTQRLLAFSRRQTLDPKPTDVNRLILGIEDMLRRTVGPTNNLEVVGAIGLWPAMIDPTQLESAILNLCINARDAMPDGGRLTIETANKWLDDHAARERDLPTGQYLSICVTDTGSGMTQDTIQRAFEPFFTTKPIGQGTGLGLSMIYGFARQSNGQVRIYSELGQGTTICIYLPRFTGEMVLPEEELAIAAAAAASGETVLVVDDEASIRHLIDEVLDEIGYTVIGAADGAAALKVLQSGARIELLVTDVGLPNGMNGRQVADAARALRPGLKVLFITGYAENAAVGNGHLEPGMELLTKPFTLHALSNKVADMLKKSKN